MDNIKVNIKNVVKRNLTEKRKSNITESFSKLNDINNKEQRVLQTLMISGRLLDEGYSQEEIIQYLNELDVKGGIDDIISGASTYFKGAVWSEAKEYLIKWICDAFGFNQTFSTILAQGLADLDPRDLIRPFKDMPTCLTSSPHVMDSILEVVVRQLGGKVTGVNSNNYEWSGVGSNLIGNMFGDAIRKSNLGETLGGMFCKAIH
jgi:hypothetical protein